MHAHIRNCKKYSFLSQTVFVRYSFCAIYLSLHFSFNDSVSRTVVFLITLVNHILIQFVNIIIFSVSTRIYFLCKLSPNKYCLTRQPRMNKVESTRILQKSSYEREHTLFNAHLVNTKFNGEITRFDSDACSMKFRFTNKL